MNAGLAYVDNVADILILSAASENAIGRAYNAADGTDVTWKQYFTDIAKMIGAKKPASLPRPLVAFGAFALEGIWKFFGIQNRPLITREALNLTGSDNRIPIDRARQELGYTPAVSYAEGLKHTQSYIDEAFQK